MKKALVFLSLLLFITPALALEIPKPQGWVNDFAGVLTNQDKIKINDLISQIEKELTVEIAVVTLPSLEGRPVEEVALNIGREWGVGKQKNGLVILVALEEREWRIEVGSGLEGSIPDVVSSNLGRKVMVPHFKAEDYGEGIYLALIKIQKLLKNDPSVLEEYKSNNFRDFTPLFLFGAAIFFMKFAQYCTKIKKKAKKYTTFFGAELFVMIIAWFIAIDIFISALFVMLFFSLFFLLRTNGYYGSGKYGMGSGGLGGYGSSGGSGGFSFGGGGGFSGGGSGGRFLE
ncbi:TPM domain-containing protein [archaeon]|nr:TPM domain-containing protein [archaeon]